MIVAGTGAEAPATLLEQLQPYVSVVGVLLGVWFGNRMQFRGQRQAARQAQTRELYSTFVVATYDCNQAAVDLLEGVARDDAWAHDELRYKVRALRVKEAEIEMSTPGKRAANAHGVVTAALAVADSLASREQIEMARSAVRKKGAVAWAPLHEMDGKLADFVREAKLEFDDRPAPSRWTRATLRRSRK